jgi:hypothetical protein
LTVLKVAPMLRERRFASLGLAQTRMVTGSHAVLAVGNILLVIS